MDEWRKGKVNEFLTLIIYFWIRVVGTSSRIQNKNEISINLFPVCYQSLSIILLCSRLVKSHTPQRFVLHHCLKNLTMGNPVYHSEHLF